MHINRRGANTCFDFIFFLSTVTQSHVARVAESWSALREKKLCPLPVGQFVPEFFRGDFWDNLSPYLFGGDLSPDFGIIQQLLRPAAPICKKSGNKAF